MSDYKTGDKFVIEIEKVESDLFEHEVFMVKGVDNLMFNENGLDQLEPLNGDYVNENFGELQEESYEEGKKVGREEAWEMAKKVCLFPEKGGWSREEMRDILGATTVSNVLTAISAQEAINMYEGYKREQEQIKVGDVIDLKGTKCVVIKISNNCFHLIASSGHVIKHEREVVEKARKTGKHIDIESILSEIRKE